MASSSTLGSSSSSEDFQQILDERKRQNMVSIRESARRSHMRKQNRLDELMGQVSELTKHNNQILTSINVASQLYLKVEAENSLLGAQMSEITTRLHSLNEINDFINPSNGVIESSNFDQAAYYHLHQQINEDAFMNPWKK